MLHSVCHVLIGASRTPFKPYHTCRAGPAAPKSAIGDAKVQTISARLMLTPSQLRAGRQSRPTNRDMSQRPARRRARARMTPANALEMPPSCRSSSATVAARNAPWKVATFLYCSRKPLALSSSCGVG
jgi:hypothetical protein